MVKCCLDARKPPETMKLKFKDIRLCTSKRIK